MPIQFDKDGNPVNVKFNEDGVPFTPVSAPIEDEANPFNEGWVSGSTGGEGGMKSLAKVAPMLGAGLATALLPEGAPWYWSLAAGAGGAGGAKALANKLTDRPAMENVPTEAALGGVGGAIAKPLGQGIGYVAKKAAPWVSEQVPALSKLLYGTGDATAAKALAEGGKKLSGTLRNEVDDALEAIGESGLEASPKLLDSLRKISLMKSDKFATTSLGKLFSGAENEAGKEAENIALGHLQSLQDEMGNGILNEGYSKYIPKLSQGAGGSISDYLSQRLLGEPMNIAGNATSKKYNQLKQTYSVDNSTVPTTQGK